LAAKRRSTKEAPRTAVGPRVHPLSVVTLGFLAAYILAALSLVIADFTYTDAGYVWGVIRSPAMMAAIRLSALTSCATLVLVVLFAVPVGYALSRYRFRGHVMAEAIVDLPIVLPPLVIGVSLLVLFQTAPGRWIENSLVRFVYTVKGIVLCQFMVSASYGIRAAKAAFDGVDRRLEQLALTLGCTPTQAFRRVSLPLSAGGIVAGGIMAWARAVGVFGPLMVFAGSVRMKTEVMPTAIYLELSVGHIEAALAVALVMVALATCVLVLVHKLAPDRKW